MLSVTYCDSKASRHPIQIVWMLAHSHDFGNDGIIRPVNSENFGELFEVLGSRLANGEDGVAKPAHA